MKKKGMLRLAKRIAAGMLATVVCASTIGATSLVVHATENTGEIVTSKEEFLVALEQKKSPIIVNGVISADNGADTAGKMYPVYIPEGTVIRGGTASSEGIGPSLSFRSPIQLTGSDVVIENIQMQFSSSDAFGSVPHREIFLAGHSLTLDNVSTYLEGADSSLGGLGGTESELLPTVYAGGFEGTAVGSAASLTVQNANADTVFQAIYMGHDEGTDSKEAYTDTAALQLGQKVNIRDGIFTDVNSSASIDIIGSESDASSNNLNNIAFYGNADTTLTVKNTCLNKTTVSDVGNVILDENAVFELSSGSFKNITVKKGVCLNLNSVQDVILSGNFTGGGYDAEASADTRGILVLNEEGSLTIEGTVYGETFLHTEDKNFPGEYAEKTYVSATGCEEGATGFVLPEEKTGVYELNYENNCWSVGAKNLDIEVAEIEVVSAPTVVDINDIIGTDFIPAENAPYCEIVWKDTEGNALDIETVDALMLYYYDMIIAVKTEYWESAEASTQEDWANPIEFAVSEEAPGKYYFYVDEANTGLSGTYTFILLSESAEPDTIADAKELKDSGMVLAEFEVAFYNSAKGESEPSPNPEPNPEPNPDPTPIDIAGENITVSTIESQIYTGNEICPEVTVKNGGIVLEADIDYSLSYADNIDVGTASVTITGKGNYIGSRSINFAIVSVEIENQTYTVTFNSMGGSNVEAQRLEKDGLVALPAMPVKEGYTLCGWSKDDTFTKDWDFETDTVQGDITLYARWKENILDKENTDTGICIEIMDADSCVYTGKAIVPKVKVWDANKVLTEGVDYKVTCKNNVNACDHTDLLIKASKKPQVIIQGVGAYKSAYKFVEYFSIKQADMAELEITVPKRVAAKAKDKLQKISPVVKTDKIKVAAKNYVVSYYADDKLTKSVSGITTPGNYYITVEAKKNKDNVCDGNFKGISEPVEVIVTDAAELLDKAKVSTGKNLVVNPQIEDTDAVIRTIITQLKIGKSTYKTEEDALNVWKQYFEVAAIDYDGSEIKQDEFYKVLHTAGTKTVVIRAVEGNDKNYTGEKNVKITVKGTKLKKDMFKLTYGSASDKAVTQTDYTASSMVPEIYTDLVEGEDYQVLYKYGKNIISEDEIVNAGTYIAVISGKNKYSGSISQKFTIKKANLATAYKDGKLVIVNDGQPVEQRLAGAEKKVEILYDADATGDLYNATDLTNADYGISYKNNKNVSANGKTAYVSIKGRGNFVGTLTGDGRSDNTNTKNGIAKELNYIIGLKDINSTDVHVLVKGLIIKKAKVTGAKLEVYDFGKIISSAEYSSALSETGDNLQLIITGKDKNYTGSRTITMNTQLIKASDSKSVKISYKENKNYYYNGNSHQPELVIKDKEGKDITDCFVIEYGENTKSGKGSITVTGKLEKGYCDKKVLKFTILPKWMQWILR